MNTFLLVPGSGVAAHGVGVCPAYVESFLKCFDQFTLPPAVYKSSVPASSPTFRIVRLFIISPIW